MVLVGTYVLLVLVPVPLRQFEYSDLEGLEMMLDGV